MAKNQVIAELALLRKAAVADFMKDKQDKAFVEEKGRKGEGKEKERRRKGIFGSFQVLHPTLESNFPYVC